MGIIMTNSKPLRLFFLRHGQTENFEIPPFNGWRDAPLTAYGRQQLQQVAEALSPIGFEAVYSSDLSRAVYGGRCLADRLGLELNIDQQWREICFGQWEGFTFQQILKKDSELVHRIFSPGGHDVLFPGGESAYIFGERIRAALAALKEKHPQGGKVALVAHGGVCKMLWEILLKLSPGQAWQTVRQDFAAVNVADIYSSDNVVAHLINGYVGPEGYYQSGPGFERLAGRDIF